MTEHDELTNVIEDLASNAIAMTWDGCHKIYLITDEASLEETREMGYGEGGTYLLEKGDLGEGEEFESLAEATQFAYEHSCPLRFIHVISQNENGEAVFGDGIEQFDERFEDVE